MTDTALARSDFSLSALGRRIDLYKQPGWGLESATREQLNLLALYCQKLRLLPGEEVTLYGGKPWITVDGRVTMMRRDHKDEYRGHSLRPLSKEEKELWGWSPEDIVIECTVRTVTTGEIKAYGRVRKSELEGTPRLNKEGRPAERLNPLALRGNWEVELAMKRALARGERFAFGTAHDDEDPEEVARMEIEERNDRERIARNSAEYDRTIGAADWGENKPRDYPYAGSPNPAVQSDVPADAPSPPSSAGALVSSKNHPLWEQWLETERKVRTVGLDLDTAHVKLGEVTEESLAASIATLESMLADADD